MPQTIKAVLSSEAKQLFRHFHECFNATIGFWDDISGNAIYSIPEANCRCGPDLEYRSKFCALLADELYGVDPCRASDLWGQGEAARRKSLFCYKCHAGLIEMTKPVYIRDRLIGFVTTGQFRPNDRVLVKVMKDWSKRHPPEVLNNAYLELTCLNESMRDHVGGIFSALIDLMVLQNVISLSNGWILSELLEYMKANAEKSLTLEEVARFANKSSSTVSHLFTTQLGQSFKQVLINTRLQKAERFMFDNPHCTVHEAAAAAGYNDVFYFSRVYKKHRNKRPRDFLKERRRFIS